MEAPLPTQPIHGSETSQYSRPSQDKSDFVALFGCPPEKIGPRLQRISNAFAAPQSSTAACDDCLGADFLAQAVKSAPEEIEWPPEYWTTEPQGVHRSSDHLPSRLSSHCQFCKFLLMQLQDDPNSDIDWDAYQNPQQRIRFTFSVSKNGWSDDDYAVRFHYGAEGDQYRLHRSGDLALTPVIG